MTNAFGQYKHLKDILVISDDKSWVWMFLESVLEDQKTDFVKLPSSIPIRSSWSRFKDAERIIIHWESTQRRGGAIIEEILDVAPHYDVGDKIIVITTNPTHEDVVYFSELGVRRIIKTRQTEKHLTQCSRELRHHLGSGSSKSPIETRWREILRTIDFVPGNAVPGRFSTLFQQIESLRKEERQDSARYYDAKACLLAKSGNHREAEKLWLRSLDYNSNYYRTYNNLIRMYLATDRLDEALSLMKKMHTLNKDNSSRMVDMGELYQAKDEPDRAEHYFNLALERDSYCSRALNGLAEINFLRGNLDESRRLLARSNLAYKLAQRLNSRGIEMVNQAKYEDALQHYSKAQYVIPQQEKGPMLFFNMGLCYSRWGKVAMAKQFLRLALIKEPNYKKAYRLLTMLETGLQKAS